MMKSVSCSGSGSASSATSKNNVTHGEGYRSSVLNANFLLEYPNVKQIAHDPNSLVPNHSIIRLCTCQYLMGIRH